MQAKELGVWHGLGAPADAPSYYGPAAHDGRTRYLALDGAPLGGLSTIGKDAMLLKARARGGVLISDGRRGHS